MLSQSDHLSRRRLAVALLLLSALLASPHVSPAAADTTPPSGTPATVSADVLPTWQVNGVVWQQVVVGDTVYATGRFSRARPPGTAPGDPQEIPARNLFAYDIRTGERVSSFTHGLNAQGLSIAASPDGNRLYVGGDFTLADGRHRSRLAAFDLTTGSLDPEFRPRPSGPVNALVATSTRVYLGGDFRRMGGRERKNLASVSARRAHLSAWAPTVDASVRSMTLAPRGDRLIVGGQFEHLNDEPASGTASIDLSYGQAMPWAANQTIQTGGRGSGTLSLHSDGTNIWGSAFSTGTSGNFEGTFAADPDTGELRIVNDCRGDTYDTFATGGVLYAVGHAHRCAAIGSFPEAENPRVWRRALTFSLDPRSTNTGPFGGRPASAVLHWFPRLSAGTVTKTAQAAWSIVGNDEYLALGGEFPRVNGVEQAGLARFAIRDVAPNLRGPEADAADAPPRAQPSGAGRVTVRWPSYVDQDNRALRYQVFRDEGLVPIVRVRKGSVPWARPRRHFVDSGLVPGDVHTYRVRVVDAFGNAVWMPTTDPVTVR